MSKVIPRTDQEVLLDNLTKSISKLSETGGTKGVALSATDNAVLDVIASSVHTEDLAAGGGDKGIFVFAVRNDAHDCTANNGDYVAFTTNHDGDVYTQDAGTHKDDHAFTLGTSKGTMMMGFAGTQSVDANDAGAVAMETNGSLHVHATNIIPGVAATSLGKAEDAAASSGDTGVMALVVRKDIAECLAQDGDYQPMQCDVDGTIRTQNTFGTWGTILVNDTTEATCGVHDRDFVAIYMLTDTVFASGAGGLSAKTAQLYLDNTNTSTDIDANAGTAIDGITFPAGMTLYGRYTGFTLASGSVIAYVG